MFAERDENGKLVDAKEVIYKSASSQRKGLSLHSRPSGLSV